MLRPSAGLLALCFCGAAVAADPPAKVPFAGSATDAINHYIVEGWKTADIKKAADKAPDTEFLRRCFIDLIGRIAGPDEVIDFEQDRSPNKRAKLVTRLLNSVEYTPKVNGVPVKAGDDGKKNKVYNYSEEFANHWANQWTVLLLSRTSHRVYREQLHAWLADEFSKDTPHNEIVTQLLTATGAGNRNGAANFVAVHLGDPIPADQRADLGNHDAVPITSRVTRLFLGIQTQCVQCHDHPFIKGLEQSDFWGVNAFFRQTTRSATPTSTTGNNRNMMVEDKLEVKDSDAINKAGRVYFERRDGKMMATKSVFLKGYAAIEIDEGSAKGPRLSDGKTRREQLAAHIVGHDNFARAQVNRVWGHLFGRGLQKDPTIDDFGSHNEIVHRELIDKLADDFVKYNYNTKALLEWICTSDVYSLSHVANKDYADPKYDPYFARMPLKAMSPETLFDALAYATQSEAVTSKDPVRRRQLRDAWLGKLVRNFGDDEGNEMTFNGTIVQALLMMNGKELNDEVKRKDTGVVAETMKKHARKRGEAFFHAVVDDLFLTALNRHATRVEMTTLLDIMKKGGVMKSDKPDEPTKGPYPPKGKGPNPPPMVGVGGSYLFDTTYYQDVFWALLNTNEFILNH